MKLQLSKPRRTLHLQIAWLAMVALVFSSCGIVSSTIDLTQALDRAGFKDPTVTQESGSVLIITAKDVPSSMFILDGIELAKKLAWTTYPRRFELLRLNIAPLKIPLSYAKLTEELGPRDPKLDEKTIDEELSDAGKQVLIVILAVGAVSLVFVGLLVWFLIRWDRKKRARAAEAMATGAIYPSYYPPPAQPGYPPPAQPGYPPPAQPGYPPPAQPGYPPPAQPGYPPPPQSGTSRDIGRPAPGSQGDVKPPGWD